MGALRLGPLELVIILVIVLLIFGVGRLGRLGKDLGEGIREFRKGLSSEEGEGKKEEAEKSEEKTA
jgi:sec-independent protein translocase protein TatA